MILMSISFFWDIETAHMRISCGETDHLQNFPELKPVIIANNSTKKNTTPIFSKIYLGYRSSIQGVYNYICISKQFER